MGKALSILLLIIITPIFFATLFLLSLKLTVLNPNFIKEELKNHNAYSIIYKNIPELTKSMVIGGEGPDAEKAEEGAGGIFSAEETTAFFYNTVTEKNFQEKTEATIDSVWPWVFGSQELKTIPISDIRQKLSDNILTSFRQKYDALPYCKNPSEFKYDLKTCKLQGKSFDELLAEFLQQKNGNPSTQFLFAGNLPNEFDIQKFTEPNPQLKTKFAGAQDVRSRVSPIIGNIYFIFPTLLIVIFLLSRLFAGSWRKTPKFFGIYLAVITSIFLIVSLVNTKLVFPRLIDFANGKIKTLPTIKNELLVPMIKDIFKQIGTMQFKISLTLIVFGIVLAVGFSILNKYLPKKSPMQTDKTKKSADLAEV
jgi:hypothetical protein